MGYLTIYLILYGLVMWVFLKKGWSKCAERGFHIYSLIDWKKGRKIVICKDCKSEKAYDEVL